MSQWFENNSTLVLTGSGELNSCNIHKDAQTIIVNGYSSIGDDVFLGRTSLTSLQLDNHSITYVGNHLFKNTKVSSFHIPFSLEKISSAQPFDQNDYLEYFTIDPNHKYYAVVSGVLYSKDLKQLICYPGGKKDLVFNVPDGTEDIFNAAIGKNTYLKHVIIPPSVKIVTYLGYLGSYQDITIFRCGNDSLQDTIATEEDPFPAAKNINVYTLNSKYQYTISGDSKTLTVFPMKCYLYKYSTNIEFVDAKIVNNDKLETVIFQPGITSFVQKEFSSSTNIKQFIFQHNKLCTRQKLIINFSYSLYFICLSK